MKLADAFRLTWVLVAFAAILVAQQYVSQQRFGIVGMRAGGYLVFDSRYGRAYDIPLTPPKPESKMERPAIPPGTFKPEI